MDNANYVHFGKRPSHALTSEEVKPEKKKIIIGYKECLKNHAAAIGGNATDGCGEFMPSGDEGTLEALKCSACNCHRNFHRKVIESESSDQEKSFSSQNHYLKVLPVADQAKPVSGQYLISPKKSGSSAYDDHSDEKERKRFRTKFSQEQKEKMLRFAEKAGWRIQKLDESLVQQFCQEIGIKKRVLKVWMHNNKNTSVKRNFISSVSPLEAT